MNFHSPKNDKRTPTHTHTYIKGLFSTFSKRIPNKKSVTVFFSHLLLLLLYIFNEHVSLFSNIRIYDIMTAYEQSRKSYLIYLGIQFAGVWLTHFNLHFYLSHFANFKFFINILCHISFRQISNV